MLAATIAVFAEAFRVSHPTSLQLAQALPWIDSRALSIAALLLFGNVFCMTCPFTLLRDAARKVVRARARWPAWLRHKWIAVGLLILYLWAYDAFSLWQRPLATAWVIAVYSIAVLAVDGVFRGASFCKYVCPVGQFNFVLSTVSPREVRLREPKLCHSCVTHDCIRGNARTRGCELKLYQPAKTGNMDCTFCLDCVVACPSGNVALLPTPHSVDPSMGMLARTDVLALFTIIISGAFVNMAGMAARFAAYAPPARFAVFVICGTLALPALAISTCAGINRLFLSGERTRTIARRGIAAFLPLGIAMWAAHLFFHVAPAGMVASTVRQTQILILDCGILATLYNLWRIARWHALPWTLLSLLLYAAGAWLCFQPMRMPGMNM